MKSEWPANREFKACRGAAHSRPLSIWGRLLTVIRDYARRRLEAYRRLSSKQSFSNRRIDVGVSLKADQCRLCCTRTAFIRFTGSDRKRSSRSETR